MAWTGRAAPSYKDANHKPELLVAIEPTDALCGFRSILNVRGLAHGLGSAAWQELVERTCGPGTDDTSGLRALLTELLTCGGPHLAGLVADVLAAGAELSPADAALTGPPCAGCTASPTSFPATPGCWRRCCSSW